MEMDFENMSSREIGIFASQCRQPFFPGSHDTIEAAACAIATLHAFAIRQRSQRSSRFLSDPLSRSRNRVNPCTDQVQVPRRR